MNKVILEGEVRRVRKVRREQRVLLARRVWRAQPALRLKALAAAIPCSRLVVFPDIGQLVLWEEPVRIASDLTAFVAYLL